KPLKRYRVLRQIIWQEFQRNRAVQTGIDGLVDNAHSPCAQFFYDAKVRDRLANHHRTRSSVSGVLLHKALSRPASPSFHRATVGGFGEPSTLNTCAPCPYSLMSA